MVLPSSGSSISFDQIQTEFGGSNPISMNEYGDKIGLTVGTTSTHSINSFFGLSSEVEIHSSTFSPAFEGHLMFFLSGQPIYYYSGFGNLSTGTITDNTFPNSGTFSDGTTTHSANAVIMTSMHAYSNNNSTTASHIALRLRTSSGGVANDGWTKMEIYANTAGTGTPLLSVNRADATYQADDSATPQNSVWFWSASYALSSYFGTNDNPAGSPTHLIRLVL